MAGITLKSKADAEMLKQGLHGYFLLFDPKTGTFEVGTYEVAVQKQNQDGTCVVQPTRTKLPSGDRRFQNFAQTNHTLMVEILAHKEQVNNPDLTRTEAIAKAEEQYASVVN